jgi:hypothetical protein
VIYRQFPGKVEVESEQQRRGYWEPEAYDEWFDPKIKEAGKIEKILRAGCVKELKRNEGSTPTKPLLCSVTYPKSWNQIPG